MRTASLFISPLIGSLFIFKYGYRCLPSYIAMIAAILYIIVFFIYSYYVLERLHISESFCRKINYAILGIVTLTVIFINSVLDKYSLNVDRWSALQNTISFLLEGKYPFFAVTHLNNHCSTMPAWMLFHIPFYLIGEIGLSIIASLLIFSMLIRKTYGSRILCQILLLLLLCPSFWYEIVVISDLQSNMLLVVSFVCYTINNKEFSNKINICLAFLVGLLLSTRMTVCFPLFFSLFPYWWNLGIKGKFSFLFTVLITYSALIAPFIFWNGKVSYFLESNPYQVQVLQFDAISIVLIIIVSVLLLIKVWHKKELVYASSSISLFLFIFSVFTSQYIRSGFTDDLSSYHYDITYLAQAIPFALIAITITRENERAAIIC